MAGIPPRPAIVIGVTLSYAVTYAFTGHGSIGVRAH
jgi:hypothetical protein